MLDIRCMHLTTLAFMHCYILQSLEPAFFPMSALVIITHVVGILQISEAISWMQQQIFNYMLAYL